MNKKGAQYEPQPNAHVHPIEEDVADQESPPPYNPEWDTKQIGQTHWQQPQQGFRQQQAPPPQPPHAKISQPRIHAQRGRGGSGDGPSARFADQRHIYQSPRLTQEIPVFHPLLRLGKDSVRIPCPHCGAVVQTEVRYTPNAETHCWASILCFFFGLFCVCLPYCIDSCQDASHQCPNCKIYIGTSKY